MFRVAGWRVANESRSSDMTQTYILRDPEIAKRMVNFIKATAGPANAAGRPLVVEIREHKARRSDEQNRKLHALLNEISENVCVNGRYFEMEVWKEQVRRRFIGTEEIHLPDGTRIERGISTTTLDVGQFSELIERVTAWAHTELAVETA